eukprot:COSAG02_NODE_40_length_47766_cov_88.053119_5_plen_158_part_00
MKINSTLHRFGYRRRRQPARPLHSHLIPVFHVVSVASHYSCTLCSCPRSCVPSLDPSFDPPHVDRRAHLMIISCPIIAVDHRPVVGKNAFDCLNGGCECTGKHLRRGLRCPVGRQNVQKNGILFSPLEACGSCWWNRALSITEYYDTSRNQRQRPRW